MTVTLMKPHPHDVPILSFLYARLLQGTPPPRLSDISAALDISQSTVCYRLRRLKRHGLLAIAYQTRRGITLTDAGILAAQGYERIPGLPRTFR